MAADRVFYHRGLRVDVYGKSFKWTGMSFTARLWDGYDDQRADARIREMIDAAQNGVNREKRATGHDVQNCVLCMRGETDLCQDYQIVYGDRRPPRPTVPSESTSRMARILGIGWLRCPSWLRKPTCQCPPPFIPQRNGTCGVCALPPKNDQ